MRRRRWAAVAALAGGRVSPVLPSFFSSSRPRPPSWPPCPVRRLARRAGPEAAAEPESSRPIAFSTSKASPRVWTVARSMGSNFQRSWVKVLPVSLLVAGLLLWCAFREETEVDQKVVALFYEQWPGVSDEAPPNKLRPPPREDRAGPGKGEV